MVLYVFVVSYVGGTQMTLGQGPGRGATLAAIACAGALVVELFVAVLGSGLKGIGTAGAHYVVGFGTPKAIGALLLTRFLAPFEIASYLLLLAAVGAVTLARRRGGLEDGIEAGAPTISAMDFLRPRPLGTGTMAEGAGQLEGSAAGHAGASQEPR
jgi:hypothetical protein